MARAVSTNRKLVFTVIGWSIGFIIFFPILWTFLTSFKTEGEAIANRRPPSCSSTGRRKITSKCRAAPTISSTS